ncbi:MAG: DUF748 domain-containing protein [Desulfuromonadales bacterium]|nr:DUF748 domain-containing protein [Desulfuromonadales bacterium]
MTIRRKKLWGTGLLCLLLLGGALLVLPGLLVTKAQRWVLAETGRQLSVADVSFNPFTLTLTVDDLSLSDADPAQTFLSWQRLQVSLSVASLYHRAPVIDRLQIDQPRIHLVRRADNRFNFSDLIPTGDEEPRDSEPNSPTLFSLNNLTISSGQIDFTDLVPEQPVEHRIRELQLALPAIGNLPYLVDRPVVPRFAAVINGAALEIAGDARPFAGTLEMSLAIDLDNIDLPDYLAYLPARLPARLDSGRLDMNLDLRYRAGKDMAPTLEIEGQVALAVVEIREHSGAPLFFLPLLQADIAPSQPLTNDLQLRALRLYNLAVYLDRNRQGEWNHARLGQKRSATAEPAATGPQDDSPPLRLQIDRFQLHNGELYLADDLIPDGFRTVARNVTIDVDDFSLETGQTMPLELAFNTDHEESVRVAGRFGLSPLSLDLQTEAKDLRLAAYAPYYRESCTVPLDGTLSARARLRFAADQALLVSNGTLALRDFALPFNDREALRIAAVDVAGLSYDLGRNRLLIEALSHDRLSVDLSRNSQGQWSPLAGNLPVLQPDSPTTEASRQSPPDEPSSPPLEFHIGELTVRDAAVTVTDHLPAATARFRIEEVNMRLTDLAAPEPVETALTFSATWQPRGRIAIDGRGSLAAQNAAFRLNIASLPLTDLAPYLAEQTDLLLKSGRLNTALNVRLTAEPKPTVKVAGAIGVNRLHLLDALLREDLLKWDSLQIAGIEAAAMPLTLDIESITLNDYAVKLLIDEQQRLNLREALSKGSAPAEDTKAPERADKESESAEESDQTHIRIGTLVLQGGAVDFTDRSLPQPFHADMQNLGGRISGLDSDPQAVAEVDLRGSLRNQSPLVITGWINPLAAPPSLDLQLNFRDIELSPLSPYSETFVGYLIDKGKLNLDLNYRLEQNRLQASNRIFLDQFTFGAPVDSDRAINLPVKLAVALLKDRKGEIYLDIPVSGSLDDPRFSIAGVIWQVVRNLLVKAATSPMALLGALFGGDTGDFSSVQFAHGSSRLTTAEQEKIGKIALALQDRPALNLEIRGYIDPELDPEGYRREWLRRQVQRVRYFALLKEGVVDEGVDVESVSVVPEDYPDDIWQVYKETDFPKPRNFIGLLKKLPPEEQEKLIYANIKVDEAELAKLALQRAQTVQSFLINQMGLEAGRLFLLRPDNIATPPADGDSDGSRVEFGISMK